MSESTPGYNRAVAPLITGIVSIILVPLCGLGVLTAIIGIVLGITASRVAAQAHQPRSLATAGIVVNGVVVALGRLAIAFGRAALGAGALAVRGIAGVGW